MTQPQQTMLFGTKEDSEPPHIHTGSVYQGDRSVMVRAKGRCCLCGAMKYLCAFLEGAQVVYQGKVARVFVCKGCESYLEEPTQ